MITGALIVAILLTAMPGDEYPLAAAFAIDGKALIVEVHGGATRLLETPGLEVRQADLSRDRKLVVVAAAAPKAAFQGLYLVPTGGGAPSALETGVDGHLRDPRFTPDGKAILFAATGKKTGGPETPTQLWRYTLSTRRTEALSADAKLCSFSPAQLGTEVLHVGTNCFSDYDVMALTPISGKARSVMKVRAPNTELATSFDGTTSVFTTDSTSGTTVWVVRGKEQPVVLTTLAGVHGQLQPRFTCPRDVLLAVNGSYSVLNSKTGELTAASASCAADGGAR